MILTLNENNKPITNNEDTPAFIKKLIEWLYMN